MAVEYEMAHSQSAPLVNKRFSTAFATATAETVDVDRHSIFISIQMPGIAQRAVKKLLVVSVDCRYRRNIDESALKSLP